MDILIYPSVKTIHKKAIPDHHKATDRGQAKRRLKDTKTDKKRFDLTERNC